MKAQVALPKRARAALPPLLLCLLSLLPSPRPDALPGDAERADLLVDAGSMLLDASLPEEARQYALRALQFDDRSADAHLLLGRVARAQGRRATEVREYREALELGSLRRFAPAEARKGLAAALVGMRRGEEALEVLRGIGTGDLDGEALVLRARALRLGGDLDGASASAREATRLYPDTAEAWVLLADIERADNRPGDARRTLAAARIRLPADPRVLAALLGDARSAESAAELAAAYFGLPSRPAGLDARASLAAMRSDPAGAAGYLDRFLAGGGLADEEALRSARALVAGNAELTGTLEVRLAAWSGVRLADDDGDGTPDRRLGFVEGRLAEWALDADQDGVEEIVVARDAEGRPRSATLRDAEGETASVEYSAYPWVERVAFERPSLRRRYELLPATLRLRIEESGRESSSPRLSPDYRYPREERVRSASFAFSDTLLPEESVVARTLLAGGVPVRLEADVDGDRRVDHVVLFEGGAPSSGKRDLDDDGVFETAELYEEGSLARIDVDSDGDGKADFSRSYRGEWRDRWDLDGDGVVDVELSSSLRRELLRLSGLNRGSVQGP